MIFPHVLDRRGQPIFLRDRGLTKLELHDAFINSRGYGLVSRNGDRLDKPVARIHRKAVERLIELIYSRSAAIERRKAAASIYLGLYCGVPYHNLQELDFSQEDGFLYFKHQLFLPFTKPGLEQLWRFGVNKGICDSVCPPPLEEMTRVFSFHPDAQKTAFLAFSMLRDGLVNTKSIVNCLRANGLPRSPFYPQAAFVARVDRFEAPNQFKSLFFLPWARIPPYLEGPTVIQTPLD